MIPFQNKTGKNKVIEDFASRSLQELQLLVQEVVSVFILTNFACCSKIERKLTVETVTACRE